MQQLNELRIGNFVLGDDDSLTQYNIVIPLRNIMKAVMLFLTNEELKI